MRTHGNVKLPNLSRGLAVATFVAIALPSAGVAQRFITTDDAEFPRVQYADSLYSLNDQCIVRLRKLSLRIPPVYVNGLPIGFC